MKKFTKALAAIMLMIVLFFATGCEPEDNPQTEPGMPKVETDSLVVTPTSVVCYGNVLSDGGGDILERGVCWYGEPYPTFTLLEDHTAPVLSDHRMVAGGDLGGFSRELNHYGTDSIYYFRAYAKNDAGVSYGSEKVLVSIFDPDLEDVVPVTLEDLPTVRITSVSDVTESHALCVGAITDDGGSAIVERGFCWRSVNSYSYHYLSVQGTDAFTGILSNLLPNTTYYVRAYAVNEKGRGYSNEMSFTTKKGNGDYVDLGLPSGTLWATCNVGASAPEDFGDYFYFLDASYMSAAIPSKAQWEELLRCTTHTCTTLNGVEGLRFMASNGNSLFLPAATDNYDSQLIGIYYTRTMASSVPGFPFDRVPTVFIFSCNNYYYDYYYDFETLDILVPYPISIRTVRFAS